MGPMDIEVGRIAVVHDPWGAVFSVIRLNDRVASPSPQKPS